MIINLNRKKTHTETERARVEWEEMDPEGTSYAMRHKAEQRYLTLLRLDRLAGVGGAVKTVAAPETWRARAERKQRGAT